MKIIVFALVCSLYSIISFSQDSTKSRSISILANFSTVPVQKIIGTDTSFQNALSISPSIAFRGKNGWGISYSPSIVTSGSNPGIYMHTVSAGYQNNGNKGLDFSFDYSHFFISKNTDIPYTPIHNELYLSLTHTKKWLQPHLSGSIGFGKSTKLSSSSSLAYDINLSGGVDHEFGWDIGDIFSYISLTPSLLINAGTNEYYSFLRASKYLSYTSNFDNYVKKGSKTSNTFSKPNLNFRNLEMDLETTFEAGSFSITLSEGVYLPLSGLDKSIGEYWEVSLKYHFTHS